MKQHDKAATIQLLTERSNTMKALVNSTYGGDRTSESMAAERYILGNGSFYLANIETVDGVPTGNFMMVSNPAEAELFTFDQAHEVNTVLLNDHDQLYSVYHINYATAVERDRCKRLIAELECDQ